MYGHVRANWEEMAIYPWTSGSPTCLARLLLAMEIWRFRLYIHCRMAELNIIIIIIKRRSHNPLRRWLQIHMLTHPQDPQSLARPVGCTNPKRSGQNLFECPWLPLVSACTLASLPARGEQSLSALCIGKGKKEKKAKQKSFIPSTTTGHRTGMLCIEGGGGGCEIRKRGKKKKRAW